MSKLLTLYNREIPLPLPWYNNVTNMATNRGAFVVTTLLKNLPIADTILKIRNKNIK